MKKNTNTEFESTLKDQIEARISACRKFDTEIDIKETLQEIKELAKEYKKIDKDAANKYLDEADSMKKDIKNIVDGQGRKQKLINILDEIKNNGFDDTYNYGKCSMFLKTYDKELADKYQRLYDEHTAKEYEERNKKNQESSKQGNGRNEILKKIDSAISLFERAEANLDAKQMVVSLSKLKSAVEELEETGYKNIAREYKADYDDYEYRIQAAARQAFSK